MSVSAASTTADELVKLPRHLRGRKRLLECLKALNADKEAVPLTDVQKDYFLRYNRFLDREEMVKYFGEPKIKRVLSAYFKDDVEFFEEQKHSYFLKLKSSAADVVGNSSAIIADEIENVEQPTKQSAENKNLIELTASVFEIPLGQQQKKHQNAEKEMSPAAKKMEQKNMPSNAHLKSSVGSAAGKRTGSRHSSFGSSFVKSESVQKTSQPPTAKHTTAAANGGRTSFGASFEKKGEETTIMRGKTTPQPPVDKYFIAADKNQDEMDMDEFRKNLSQKYAQKKAAGFGSGFNSPQQQNNNIFVGGNNNKQSAMSQEVTQAEPKERGDFGEWKAKHKREAKVALKEQEEALNRNLRQLSVDTGNEVGASLWGIPDANQQKQQKGMFQQQGKSSAESAGSWGRRMDGDTEAEKFYRNALDEYDDSSEEETPPPLAVNSGWKGNNKTTKKDTTNKQSDEVAAKEMKIAELENELQTVKGTLETVDAKYKRLRKILGKLSNDNDGVYTIAKRREKQHNEEDADQ